MKLAIKSILLSILYTALTLFALSFLLWLAFGGQSTQVFTGGMCVSSFLLIGFWIGCLYVKLGRPKGVKRIGASIDIELNHGTEE